MRSIGLMSGTSGDGVDAVLLEIEDPDRRGACTVIDHAHVDFDDTLRTTLQRPHELTAAQLSRMHFQIPNIYATAVQRLRDYESAEVIGMHGQTVWHEPPSRRVQGSTFPNTLQVGSSSVLATLIRLPVVGDLRSADVVRGGEGAPIMPLCHWLFADPAAGSMLVVNIGGIANYTHVGDSAQDVTASDIGPGMMITDALARHVSGGTESFDRDGILSAAGTADRSMVDHILAHPFFCRPQPRSTGREDFGADFVGTLLGRFGNLRGPDLIKSSIVATARAIVSTCQEVPAISSIVLTGGGALHPTLRATVAQLSDHPVIVHESGPLAPLVHEPAGMALIAARTIRGLPSSLPRVTGASDASVLGHVARP